MIDNRDNNFQTATSDTEIIVSGSAGNFTYFEVPQITQCEEITNRCSAYKSVCIFEAYSK